MKTFSSLPRDLRRRGWKVTSERVNEDGEPGLVSLERLAGGIARRATGKDLAHAISDARDLEKRLGLWAVSHARSSYGDPVNPQPSTGGSSESNHAARLADGEEAPPPATEASDMQAGR
jgi:hypothetical protein